MLTKFFQAIINGLGVASNIFDLLPLSPFLKLNAVAIDREYLQFISWIIPFPEIISLLEGWLVCIAIWYVSQKLLRWIKQIE